MSYPFVRARWYTKTNGRAIDVIVVHTMEAPEKGTTAESVANYFATTKVKASAHYNVDCDSVVQSVLDKDVAYHAPGANHNGIGIEHAGYAGQGAAGWADPYSVAMLQRSAKLTRELCDRYDIPMVWLSPADLRAGKRGITSHHNVSLAFGKSEHWDPGPDFPVASYIAAVRGTSTTPGVRDVELLRNQDSGAVYVKHGERMSKVDDLGMLAELENTYGKAKNFGTPTMNWLLSKSVVN